ncbi:putative phosphatidylinositol N-acetylglucosaminyltransferase [Gregarina niphandrodes]|uniref:Phosphatidylinositol N-acetylglucosaminyltransferase n=1 Tax=Gregarina niphandrodes TaxID=110365 RepID=A0A023B4Y7_GRENI|nr:putative phosphatidylinositol N-acetylglucosaminyltransferase [Gregarina niphandrodes]EZG57253.1 putative phosphatidylinositol N-acetylglucosaminyltransferase [Gregarina niphandrodes]|eukprot:XP_011131070.1 putative phosphatidylinositol N-acetylglucosaminyltransferase [Gregarina niphandrodes]
MNIGGREARLRLGPLQKPRDVSDSPASDVSRIPSEIPSTVGISESPSVDGIGVLMISDFVYPGLGGVETHIYQLSNCLVNMGYRVVMFSHSRVHPRRPRSARHGVRYLANGVKAYYYASPVMHEQCTWAQPIGTFPILREILVRERISIVHGHQAPSSLTLECIAHAKNLGYGAIFTDHSLFGFADAGSIHVNKCLKIFLSQIDACISVSYTNKENLCLRACIPPKKISVIPNALNYELFSPNPSIPDNGFINPAPSVVNVVMIGRLTFRKGTDLLAQAIPIIASRFQNNVRFIIGGDGPKQLLLEEMRERFGLYDRVVLLGGLSQKQVRKTLRCGHVFLNASLTEAFCIGILEAACTGLLVVCTNVGGVTEVLPPHLASFVECNPQALADGATIAIQKVLNGQWDPWAIHREVAPMYNWTNVAHRVHAVYQHALQAPQVPYTQIVKSWALSWDYSLWANIYIYFVQLFMGLLWCLYRPP